jgi:hypothetical protein
MKTPKSKKYALEQFMIQNEVIGILNLGLGQKGFYLYEIDNDKKIQKQIMDLVPDIRKYFCHVNMTGLLYPDKCKRPWLSIVRGVLRDRYRLCYQACRYRNSVSNVFTMRYYLEAKKKKVESTKNPIVRLNLTFKAPRKTLNLQMHKNIPINIYNLKDKSKSKGVVSSN